MFCFEHRKSFAWSAGNVLPGTQDFFGLGHRKCFAGNTGIVLFRTKELFCVGHRTCFAWNTGAVVRGTEEMSCLEHRKCFAWNTRIVPAHHHHPWITLNHESDLSQLARSLSTLSPSMCCWNQDATSTQQCLSPVQKLVHHFESHGTKYWLLY